MPKNDHTAFQVSNLQASLSFYTGVLGLRLLFQSINEEEQEAYAFLELEGGSLELIQTLDAPMEPRVIKPPYCPHLALETNDMGKILELVAAKGIPVVKGPLEIPGEEKWIYLSDPDNNVIEFIEWSARHAG